MVEILTGGLLLLQRENLALDGSMKKVALLYKKEGETPLSEPFSARIFLRGWPARLAYLFIHLSHIFSEILSVAVISPIAEVNNEMKEGKETRDLLGGCFASYLRPRDGRWGKKKSKKEEGQTNVFYQRRSITESRRPDFSRLKSGGCY